MNQIDTAIHQNAAASTASFDMKLEVVVIPVSDVERAKRFYLGMGWRLDADFANGDTWRVLQVTPPGSARGLFLVVSDIEAARASLVARGVAVSEFFHLLPGDAPSPGLDPMRRSYASYASFADPDGNEWLMQEVTSRAPGRVSAGDTTYSSAAELDGALRRASAAHGEHERRTGHNDAGWPQWYARYMVAEQAGQELPS